MSIAEFFLRRRHRLGLHFQSPVVGCSLCIPEDPAA